MGELGFLGLLVLVAVTYHPLAPSSSPYLESHDLVPTWPAGEGCKVEPPALIAKAGVSKEPSIPPSPGR